ncbi:MAG: hypothetical protein IJT41_02865 [Clostridia bacterium]|nr:hypothetical protein [Clostridia bacterium]
MEKTASVIRRSLSLLLAFVAWIGGMLSGEPYVASGDMILTRSLPYDVTDGVSFGQGLAADGDYFYGTGAVKPLQYNAITKIDAKTGEIVLRHEMCIPKELMRKGYAHLGDCCLYEGALFIAIEDFGFRNPGVIRYDPQTLEYIDFHPVPKEGRGNGRIPWCAIADDVLYYSQSNEVDEIRMLDVRDFSYLGALQLDTTLYKMQGGEIYDGRLYVVTNTGMREKTMTVIDLDTGHAEPVFVRCTGRLDAEGEGLAICPHADGSLFHIVDTGAQVRISSFGFKN